MADVTYIAPVESVSGKLAKNHSVVFHRRRQPNNSGIRRNYTSFYRKPLGDPSANQTAVRTLFGQVATAVKARKLDPTHAAADKAAFAAQSRYKTLHAYLWHICKEEIENA